jgi:glycosyltransferase involved in cell wall biosynthesis
MCTQRGAPGNTAESTSNPASMRDPLITIAMPFFNSAATLELAVRSLLHQSYGKFELLLCDDGSDDHGLEIARSFHDPRVISWRDGRRRRLAARLNECIDRARGLYLARMDADDIAYPDRLARQVAFLADHPDIDLCSGGALVFTKGGQPLWRFSPAGEHARITRSPFRGFPLWHPVWMGRIEWFRRWRYKESAWLAQDQELLLRSYRSSRFANLPQVLLGYRRDRVSLSKLLRYKLLHIKYVCDQSEGRPDGWEKTQLIMVSAARFAANCVAVLGGSERRMGHQGALAPSKAELEEWRSLWILLSSWYGQPSSETFLASSLQDQPRVTQERR